MSDYDVALYTQLTGLKSDNSGLEVWISVGGWAAGGQVFSDMTSTSTNRAAFIASAIKFMATYAFDGIDIDWEYPVSSDRGGAAADKANFVLLLQELKAAVGTKYGSISPLFLALGVCSLTLIVSATLPSSYWYMQNFDIVGMEPYLDWFNIMSMSLAAP